MRDGTGRTSEDRATQLLICEPLSFAIFTCDKYELYIRKGKRVGITRREKLDGRVDLLTDNCY